MIKILTLFFMSFSSYFFSEDSDEDIPSIPVNEGRQITKSSSDSQDIALNRKHFKHVPPSNTSSFVARTISNFRIVLISIDWRLAKWNKSNLLTPSYLLFGKVPVLVNIISSLKKFSLWIYKPVDANLDDIFESLKDSEISQEIIIPYINALFKSTKRIPFGLRSSLSKEASEYFESFFKNIFASSIKTMSYSNLIEWIHGTETDVIERKNRAITFMQSISKNLQTVVVKKAKLYTLIEAYRAIDNEKIKPEIVNAFVVHLLNEFNDGSKEWLSALRERYLDYWLDRSEEVVLPLERFIERYESIPQAFRNILSVS